MKTIIAGSRGFKNYQEIEKGAASCGWDISEVVSGKAKGADSLGELYARKHNIPICEFPAQWGDISHADALIKINNWGKKYDAKAGLRRNEDMAEYADALIAFWDGKSSGTKHMIDCARSKGLLVKVFVSEDKKV